MRSVLLLKESLALRFGEERTGFLGMEDKEFLRQEGLRLQCLLEDPTVPQIGPQIQDYGKFGEWRIAYTVLMRVFSLWSTTESKKPMSTLELAECVAMSKTNGDVLAGKLFRRGREGSANSLGLDVLVESRALLREALEQMKSEVDNAPLPLRRGVAERDESSVDSRNDLERSLKLLDQLIVLVDASEHQPVESTLTKELWSLVHEWLRDLVEVAHTCYSSLVPASDGPATPVPLHRRSTANELLSSTTTLGRIAATLFGLIADTVSISRGDWFRLYREHQKTTESEARFEFALGVYQLMSMGLLHEKRKPSRSDTVYERSALVWCSGS